jgi:tetratricopeptide (TPR) repeat protein
MSQKKKKLQRKLEKIGVNPLFALVHDIDNREKFSIKKILNDNWKFLMILSLVIIGLFVNGMAGDFVSDDYATIATNPGVTELSSYKDSVTPVTMSNYFLAILFGTNKIVYHLYSLLLYIVFCWVALIFLNFVFDRNLSRLTMIIFAFLPIHVEAVTWISGKPYLAIGLSVLLSFIFLVKYLEESKLRYLWVALLSLVLGIVTDPARPFSVFFVLPLYLWFAGNKYYSDQVKKILPYVLGAGMLIFLMVLPTALDRINLVNGVNNNTGSVFYNPFEQYPTGISKYLQLIVFPVDLTLYHTMYVAPVWLNWIVFSSFWGLVIYFARRDKRITFGLLFFLLTLLPSMAPVKVSWLVAERYAFLPSLGFSVFMAVLVDRLWQINKYVAGGILGIILVLFSIRIAMRNNDWTTNHKLWVNTVQVSPNSHNAWNNIGDDYDKLEQMDNAIKGFTQSTVVKPDYADAFHNRANIFYKIGRLDLARNSYETALSWNPNLIQTYMSLIQIDFMEGKFEEAISKSEILLNADPSNPQYLYISGVAYMQAGVPLEAKIRLEKALRIAPDFAAAREALMSIN